MFEKSVQQIRNSVHGFVGLTGQHGKGDVGTAFYIGNGTWITTAHTCFLKSDGNSQTPHAEHFVMFLDSNGITGLQVQLVDSDSDLDIAVVRGPDVPGLPPLSLSDSIPEVGTPIGSLGFPRCNLTVNGKSIVWDAIRRFQSSFVSAHVFRNGTASRIESDSIMYAGSSGSPGFTADGMVIGVHTSSHVEKTEVTGLDTSVQSRVAIAIWTTSKAIIDRFNLGV